MRVRARVAWRKTAAKPARTLPSPRVLVRRHVQALNDRNLDRLVELFAADAVVEFTAGPTLAGRGAIRRAYARYFREWDDVVTLAKVEVDGRLVRATGVAEGQHHVPRMNIPGRIALPLRAYRHGFTAVWEIARGRIQRHRVDYDARDFVRQLLGE
ncbi:MAG: nuclear transport factor 2 family protein [Armatimonadota bacterium]|nr:nuclear transport factor 2 family protein [Armatimonadota bacterium]MDR7457645.1 nuclear transport factor 2 family protein [Armatimonadota bacterium]